MSNNLFKHYIALLLAVVMVFALLPINVFAGDVLINVNGLTATDSGDATWTPNGNSVVGKVTGEAGGCGGNSAHSGTLTLKNTSGEKKTLSFNYSVDVNGGSIAIAGTQVSEGGRFSQELNPNASISVGITSAKGDKTTTISMTDISLVREGTVSVTFCTCENGSYTVDGTTITSEQTISKNTQDAYSLSATPASGYKFGYWYDETNNRLISRKAQYNLSSDDDISVRPYFFISSTPFFSVDGIIFTELGEAITYATNENKSVIVLIDSGTISSGTYTIPNGKTLLIPYDDGYTLPTTTTGIVEGSYSKPSQYVRLTLDSNVQIKVANGGAISVGSLISSHGTTTSSHNGTPTGKYGMITLKENSEIRIENGGSLYVYGFISGEKNKTPGTVVAENGAKVYECFQIRDWRGGSSTNSAAQAGVFPFNQYYVQNIEAKLIFEAGSQEFTYSTVNAPTFSQYPSVTVPFVGQNNGMFRINSGSIEKRYDYATDRLVITISEANAELSNLVLGGLPLVGDVNSGDFILPLNNKITINVESGSTITINQDLSLYPGVKLNIEEGATVILNSSLFVYDSSDWLGKNFAAASSNEITPSAYEAIRGNIGVVYDADKEDAVLNIDGTLIINNGELYTTSGQANIKSTGTGKIIFRKATGSTTSIKEWPGTGSSAETVSVTPAYLKHGDGTYVATAGSVANDQFVYSGTGTEGRWIKNPVSITFEANGGEGTMPVQTVEKNVETALNLNTFTREGYVFTGWNTVADGTGTAYADGANITANSDITLYAQWEVSEHTLTINYVVPEGFTAPAQYSGTFTEGEEYSVTSPNVEGCTPDTAVVTGTMGNEDVTVTVTYSVNKYTVTWKNEDGTVLETDENVPYNSTPSYDGATPVKDSDDTNHYTFTGWDPEIVPVTGPATYTAVFTAEPHTYGTPSWTWTGYTAATAVFTCSECGHTHPVTATITSVTTDPTCTSNGETVYTATVTFNGQNYTDTQTEVLSATGHTWGTPTYVWADDNSTVTATRVCANNPAHVETETVNTSYVVTKPATCENDGVGTYTATFDNPAFTTQTKEVEIPATGHNWDLDNPVWGVPTGIIFPTVTITFTCTVCGETTQITAETVGFVTEQDASCVEGGYKEATFEASFGGRTFEKTIRWDEEPADPTLHPFDLEEHGAVAATCTEEGNSAYWYCPVCEKYFSDAEGLNEIEENSWIIPATGHNWDLDNPVWGVPTGIIFPTVTITFTCTVCGETTQITAETVGFVTEQDASCVEGGYKEATFEASFGGRTFEKTIRWDEEPADPTLHPFDLEEHGAVAATCTEEGNSAYWYCPVCGKYFSDAEGLNEIEENSWIIPATGHSWGDPTWNWADDHSSATATFTCSVCGYSQTVTAEITSDTTPATPTQPGSIVYTATVEFNGNTYTNVETETLTYTGWKIDENGKTYIIDGEIAYHNQWQTIEDATYWFDDAGYVLDCGIYWLPYPEGYGPDQWNIDNSNQPYTNAGYLTNSFFSIDANGKLEKDANGFRTLPEGTVVHCKEDDETLTESFEIWLVNGEMPWHPGLVTDGTDYYYFPTGYFDAKRAKISGTNYYISKTNELEWPDIWGEGVFSTGLYTFDNEGKLQLLDGLIDKEDKTYYYDHGMLTYAGVIKIGDYFYYVKSDYTIVKDATYYVIAEKTNGLTGAGLHDFDNYGHMFLPNGDPHFTGIIKVDDDNWFYYEDGVKSYAGLIEIDGHLYYVNSQFKVIHNADYPICKTNGLKPQGTYYFDENGWLEEINETLNGIVKEGDKWYYYVDGIKTYAGVFKIGNDFYYAKSDGEVIHGRSYYISKTNGLVEKGQYDFDEEGRMFMYNGIYKNDNGIWIYYVNGVKTYAGVILIDGSYYYVKSDFQVVHDRSYVVNKTNNLVSPGTYQFDAEGHMIIN